MKNPQSSLPPGFRFHPTDEELILHYLQKRVSSIPLPVSIIAEVDIYKFDPWDLPAKAAFGEKEWYFFSPRDRKYPNGARPNRAAASGYWKATGTDKVIMASSLTGAARNENIGVNKALVFYKGRPPKGTKTNWIMHEYRLTESPCTINSVNRPTTRHRDSSMRLDDWVLCRIYKKTNVLPSSSSAMSTGQDQEEEERFLTTSLDAKLPSLTSLPSSNNNNNNVGNNTLMSQKSSSFSNLLDAMDFAMLSNFLTDGCNQANNNLSCLEPSDSVLTHHTVALDDPMHQRLAAVGTSDPSVENALKRQWSCIESEMSHPSKKFSGSTACSYLNAAGVGQYDGPGQYNYMFNNHSFLNQNLLLSPNVQFLG